MKNSNFDKFRRPVHIALFSQLMCFPTTSSIMLERTYHGMAIFLCAVVADMVFASVSIVMIVRGAIQQLQRGH